MAGWAETLQRLVKLVSFTNKVLLGDLKPDSHQLATISEEFPKWLREREGSPVTKAEIICFTEEKATGHLGKKVRNPSLHPT